MTMVETINWKILLRNDVYICCVWLCAFIILAMASARQRPAAGFYEEFFSSDEESIDTTDDETILEIDAVVDGDR